MDTERSKRRPLPRFDRHFFSSDEFCTRIGSGSLGGKAQGLVLVRDVVKTLRSELPPSIDLVIPRMIVLTTSVFDAFMERNDLDGIAGSETVDERIAHAFQRAVLPAEVVGDLKSLIDEAHAPLAIRSSSMLEDAMFRPFAGVYATKMIPNNQHDPDARFRRLVEAIKFVYASTFFSGARSYLRAADGKPGDEKMAVVVQEVVGKRHGDRFYPDVSGVARSYNFYPTGRARQEQGVVNLALGLGKTIVDGGVTWVYSPAHPAAPPPYASVGELLRNSQLRFWAVNMGGPPAYDPIREDEYLVQPSLVEAERDGVLQWVASTYDPRSDRVQPGVGIDGPRVLNFAPLLDLKLLPVNDVVRLLLPACESALDAPVEVEFAMTVEDAAGPRARLGFLQVRPMVVSHDEVTIEEDELASANLLVASHRALGNGVDDSVLDVVYVKPGAFEARLTRQVAAELEGFNRELSERGRPFLLIGFGRWGSSDPWLGIPVEWGQIAGARAIVEATLPAMNVEASQGAHFFHNISSFGVSYLTVRHGSAHGIDWEWLATREAAAETALVRHVRLERPLRIKVDGRTGRGGVWRPD